MTTYILIGFAEELGFRVFSYEGVSAGRARATFRVRADLDLARRYNLKVQDLPLLCRNLLEARADESADRVLTYSAAEMADHARRRDEAGSTRRFKRPVRRPTQ